MTPDPPDVAENGEVLPDEDESRRAAREMLSLIEEAVELDHEDTVHELAIVLDVWRAHWSMNGAVPDALEDEATRVAVIEKYVQRLDLATLLAEPDEPIAWLWGKGEQGYIERGSVVCLHGFGGLGKSLLAGALAKAHTDTDGKSLLGQPCAPGGRVLVIDAENPRREIKRRVKRINLDPERVRFLRASAAILSPGFEGWLEGEILDHRATLVILDSQRALFPGDEKEANEIRRLYSALRRIAETTDAAIVVIHHDNRQRDFSGSTDIDASVDSRLHLFRDKEDDEIVCLAHRKCRAAKAIPTFRIGIVLDSGRLFVTNLGRHNDRRKRASARASLADELRAVFENADGPLTRPQAARAIGKDPKDGTMRRAFEELLSTGAIREVRDGFVTTRLDKAEGVPSASGTP